MEKGGRSIKGEKIPLQKGGGKRKEPQGKLLFSFNQVG